MADDRRPMVGVIGDGGLGPDDEKREVARRLGRRLVGAGYRLACGGLAGVMEAACRGARESDGYFEGCTVGILPGSDPGAANPYVDIAVPTGMHHARNTLVAKSDAVVAVGGGAGTLSEMAFAWIAGRLLVGLEVDGWSGRLAGEPVDWRDRRVGGDDDRVFAAATAREAVRIVDERLPDYRSDRSS